MNIFAKWLIFATAIIFSAYLIQGVTIDNFWSAIWVAAFLSIINVTIKPMLIIFTLPINIISLGLFTFVINACILIITSSIIKGFEIENFFSAILFSVILSITNYTLNSLLEKN